MSLRIRQIVVAARDLEKTIEQFSQVLNIQVGYRDPAVAKFGLVNAMLVIGDQILEIVSPTQPNTTAGRHLDRHGDSGYMLILQTDDLARDQARLDNLGVRIIHESNLPDIKALHLHPKDIGATIVSIDEATPPESWPWAGPDWERFATSNGAQRVISSTISAVDPVAMSQRWSEVLGASAPIVKDKIQTIAINQGELIFKESMSDILSGFGLEVTDPETSLATAKKLGFNVQNNSVTICGVTFELVPVSTA